MTGWSCDAGSRMLHCHTWSGGPPVSSVEGSSACDACTHVRVPKQQALGIALRHAGGICSTLKEPRAAAYEEDGTTDLTIYCGIRRVLQKCSCSGSKFEGTSL